MNSGKSKLLVLLILVTGLFSQSRLTDSLALVSVYNAFDGANWNNKTNWLDSLPINNWYGVGVSSGRVTSISLSSNNLKGEFPKEIGNFDKLVSLNLSWNQSINDTIPKEIGNLTNLRTLQLRYSKLIGEIPDEFYNLDTLQTLYLDGNDIEGAISDSVYKLKELQTAYLYSNDLTSISNNIGKLKKLSNLRLESNKLTTLPDSIAALSALTYLNVSNNPITSIPALGNLKSLNNLDIYSTQISDLTGKLDGLTSLSTINLNSSTNLSMSNAVAELKKLGSLITLYLSSCNFSSGIPADLFTMTNLRTLGLENNGLTGTIPAGFQSLNKLNNLYLRNNSFSGQIPIEITRMKSLGNLFLDRNELSGSIPDSIGNLTNLQNLYLYSNKLTGSIPDGIGKLTKLNYLRLENNQLSGKITDSLSNITGLDYLYLSNNKFTGEFPASLANIPDIDYITVYRNGFTSLPNLTGTTLATRQFDARYNKLGFESLVDNKNGFTGTFHYNPQAVLGSDSIISAGVGDTINLVIKDNHGDNVYSWYKDNNLISGATDSVYTLSIDSAELLGNYHYRITNTSLAGVTLTGPTYKILNPDTIPPNIPTGLSSSNQNGGATFYWSNNNQNDFDKFYIYFGTSPNPTTLVDSTKNNSYSRNNLVNEQTYYLRVRAKDFWGNISNYSAQISATPDGTAPSKVQNLAAVAGDGKVTISWNQNPESDVNRYYIYYSTSVNDTIYRTNTSARSRQITGLNNGQQYYFWVRARDASNNFGIYSDAVTATPVDVAPAKPSGLTAIAGAGNVLLDWANNSESDTRAYFIYQSTSPNAATLVDSVIGRSNSHDTIFGLTDGTKYYFRLKAIDQTGHISEFSNEVSATPGNYRVADSLALVAIYNATGGANWSNSSNWLNGNLDTWQGVTIEYNRVTRLDLYSRNLNGTLPNDLGNLSGLEYLRIRQNNNLRGPIPSTIGNLVNLSTLDFYNNSLTGNLPSGMSALVNVVTLNLSFNEFSGPLNSSIGGMTSLRYLYILNNKFSGALPSEIGNLTELVQIQAYNNKFTSFPTTIGNLDKLTYLHFDNNQITALPNEFGGMANLQTIYLNNNNLSSLPAGFGNLPKVVSLRLTGNDFTTFPTAITSLTTLTQLYFGGMNISSLPSSLSNLAILGNLTMNSNKFTSIPNVVYQLSNLTQLNLQNNQITSISDSLYNLTKLTNIYLNNNQIEDTLSSRIANITNLNLLYLDNNKFKGTIPAELGSMTNLRQIYLRNNKFSGAIPDNIKNSNTLQYIYLTNNELNAAPEMKNQNIDNSLRYFYIDNNKFTFSEIIKNIGVPNNLYDYSPQRKIGMKLDTTLTAGDSITLNAIADHPDNTYQWYRNNSTIQGQTGTTLQLNNVTLDSIGTYTFRSTNPNASSLTLTSEDMIIRIPDSIAPPRPSNFRAYPRNGSIYLTWNNMNLQDLKHFNIYVGTSQNNLSLTDSSQTNNKTISSLTNGTEYFFQLSAIDLWGNESPRTSVVSGTPDGVKPGIPDSVKATPSDSRIRISWKHVSDSDLDHYRIYKGTSINPTTYYTNTSNNFYVDNSVTNGVTYFYRIVARDRALNESDFSQNASTAPVNEVPAAVTVTRAIESNESVYLQWTNAGINDFNRYELYLGNSANPDSIYTTTTSTSITINSLTNGTTYHFRLKVVDDTDLKSPFSNEVSFVPGDYLKTDSLALVAIYDSLSGDSWSRKTNWKSSQPVSTWYGVTVSNNRVRNLRLNSNNLTGELPKEIGNLTALVELEMRNNKINGGLPTEIGQLKNLDELRMYSNKLTKPLPASLGQIKGLRYIYLQNNQITGTIPSALGNLQSLIELNLYGNKLTGSIPSELGNMTKLVNLYLYNNQLSGNIPSELGQLSDLRNMNLSRNNLTGSIPSGFSSLTKIQYLYLQDNNLSGNLPSELGALKEIRYFYAYNNQLTGSIPASFGSMTRLYRFYFYNNKLSGALPAELGNLAFLNNFNVRNNNISDLPDFTSNPIKGRLYIDNNRLTFEDIIPNVSGGVNSTFAYSPQQNTGLRDTIWATPGSNVRISSSIVNRNGVTFQWRKNNGNIAGATDSIFTISNLDSNDYAYYDVYMRHGSLAGFTLYRHRVYIEKLKRPDISVSIAQNPVATKEAEFFVISDIDLRNGQPELWVSVGNKNKRLSTSTVTNGKVFRASYGFESSGRHDILLKAIAANGLDSTIQRSFTASLVRSKIVSLAQSFDKSISVKLDAKFFSKDRYLLTEKFSEKGKDFYQVGGLQHGKSEAELTLAFDKKDFKDLSKLFVYHYNGKNWDRVDTKIHASSGKAVAKVTTLGKFKLAVDPDFSGSNLIPEKFDLLHNYPNPFNPVTTIPFQLKENIKVEIIVYNLLGQKIKTLINRNMEAGAHKVKWDGKNDFGTRVASGIYFYRLVTPKFTKAQKMILIK